MRPGKFSHGVCTIDVVSGWERVLQPGGKEPFYYVTSYGRKIQPRHNFLTDLGSIPRIFWTILPPHFYKPCYICHDWDYDTQTVPRWQADRDLCEMIYTYTGGDATLARNIVWAGVRVGGWYAWKKDSNARLYSRIR